MKAIRILAIIDDTHASSPSHKHYTLIVDRMPKFVYQWYGDKLIIANDSGFHDCLRYDYDPFHKAYCGREFEIKFKEGTKLLADGKWWGCDHPERRDNGLIDVGIILDGTYGSHGGMVESYLVRNWLEQNTPKPNKLAYEKQLEQSRLTKFDEGA